MIYVKESNEYLTWLHNLTNKEQAKAKARISRIENNEHFGIVKNLSEGLAELKWTNGWRIYFISIGHKKILLINGGHKNEQEKNIKKARIYIRRITTL